jgi:hypothetical protein
VPSPVGTGNGSIVNQGHINADEGSYVALLSAKTVNNTSTINAPLGAVAWAAPAA